MRSTTAAVLALTLAACSRGDAPARERILLAATHTVEDSGLLDRLVAAFEAAYPRYALQATVSGSGQALEMGRQGDVDVLLTHSPGDERDFMEEGFGVLRREVMESDFVLVGPAEDSAAVRGIRDIGEVFRKIVAAQRTFISRADASGTHRKEQSIWEEIAVTPAGDWYLEAGTGMADALRIANERRAYILSDRPTYLVTAPTVNLEILSEGDPRLINAYAAIIPRLAANPNGARAFVDWITGPDGQALIREYGVDAVGERLFTPTAVAPAGS